MTELLPAILSDDQRRAVWLAQYRLANSRLREPEPDSVCVALAEERVASAVQRESDLAAWAALRETLLSGVAAAVQAARERVQEACAAHMENRAGGYDGHGSATAAVMANEARDGARSIRALEMVRQAIVDDDVAADAIRAAMNDQAALPEGEAAS